MANETQSNKQQIQWLLDAATLVFETHSDSARLDAELLLCHVIGRDRTYLFTWPDKELTATETDQFNQLVSRREKGEPIAHIIGYKEFWSLNFEVNPATLIPRPDTEVLVEAALEYARKLPAHKNGTRHHGLDLGTGTGAIALSLASELSHWQWLAVDVVEGAVELAKRNALNNGINNCDVMQSNWFDDVPSKKFDVIVTNPPYIDPVDQHLSQGDVRFEPRSALVSDNKGLADITKIIEFARGYLALNAPLFIEHGFDQASEVSATFIAFGYQNVKTIKDLSGKNRVTVGYL